MSHSRSLPSIRSGSRALSLAALTVAIAGSACAGAPPSTPPQEEVPLQEWTPGDVPAGDPRGAPSSSPSARGSETTPPHGSKLELVDADRVVEVKLGEVAVFTIVNTGDEPYVFHHPGGSSGCAGFRWNVTLVDTKTSAIYPDPADDPRLFCTTVMVPPRDIVFAPNEPVEVKVDTGAMYSLGFGAQERTLARSEYDVGISGADTSLRARLIVR